VEAKVDVGMLIILATASLLTQPFPAGVPNSHWQLNQANKPARRQSGYG
jgi:hypothetical protein